MSTDIQQVEAYLAAQAPEKRAALEQIRSWVRDACPEASEKISYGMPTFIYRGTYLMSYAAFKAHYGLYPGGATLDALGEQWARYRRAKGTIRLTLDEPLPEALVREIVRIRVAMIEAKVKHADAPD